MLWLYLHLSRATVLCHLAKLHVVIITLSCHYRFCLLEASKWCPESLMLPQGQVCVN